MTKTLQYTISNNPTSLTNNMKEILSCFPALTKQALEQYVPIVCDIIDNNLKDENHIQRTLDGVLDFCYDDEMLLLYRTLCKYYFDINLLVTVEYIGFYREMYDEEVIDYLSTLSDSKELYSYTSTNTPLPPLNEVPKKGFSL